VRNSITLRAVNDQDKLSGRHRAENNRLSEIRKLNELSSALIIAADALELIGHLDVRGGLNFYEEIRRFEITLITQALKYAGGSQIKAANLLKLNATTLNSKIKSFKISTP
jgi:DNA-binding protein Fis